MNSKITQQMSKQLFSNVSLNGNERGAVLLLTSSIISSQFI